ncbi:unnamed protein product [Dibothriocephalus latus]|uniref:C2 domain-containing protein n=1 Tax=Dibothriocephalus latus TaxID=60516 RepID=A0A3P7L2H1_DIBLA|nr:unnamed protein product [Dibothriocephalus latus]
MDALEESPDIPNHDDLLDFTRRFNEHILLGPTCGIPFSDDEEDEDDDDDDKGTESLLTTTTGGGTARHVARRKKRQKGKVKYGLATPDLVRWRAETDLRVPEDIRPPLGRFPTMLSSPICGFIILILFVTYTMESKFGFDLNYGSLRQDSWSAVFWGVRELRRQFLLPVNRPVITVEVGGTRVVSDLMQNAKVNPLFEHHLKFIDLNLPLDDQYWPPITVMCHDYRMFGVRITVGLCTLPVATDFFEKTALGEYQALPVAGSHLPSL